MTLAEAQTQLAAWEAALLSCATSQEYSINGRTLKRADLPEIRKTVSYFQRIVRNLQLEAAGTTGNGVKVATWS